LAALLVVVARDGDSLSPLEIERRLASLTTLPGGRRVDVPPFDAVQSRRLVRALLGLDGALVETVAERSGGIPLVTGQTIGDWVQRGVLAPGAFGFELAPGADAALPDSLRQLWAERVDAVVAPQARGALELAAALGLEINLEEWRAACAERGLDADEEVV